MTQSTSAERLHEIVRLRKLGNRFDMFCFHQLHPSTFHKGAFIFQDGSIWWAR